MRRRIQTIVITAAFLFSSAVGGLAQRRERVDILRLPDGTNLQVRLTERLDSDTNQTGDAFQAIADKDVIVNGRVEIPAGTPVTGRLAEVRDSGKVSGRARMALTVSDVRIGDVVFPIQSNTITVESDNSKGRDAGVIGGAAAIGAIIGAITGGGKGAAVGAAIGAAGGTGVVLVTTGKDVEFEQEQAFNFILEGNPASGVRPTSGSEFSRSGDRYDRSRDRRPSNEPLDLIARDLNDRAQQVWNAVRSQRGGAGARQTQEDMDLYRALREFSNSARRYSELTVEETLRSEGRNLVLQAEKIDLMLDRSTLDIRNDWAPVQNEVARLAGALGVRYGSNRSTRTSAVSDRDLDRAAGRFRWQGRVDGSDYVRVRGNSVTIQHVEARNVADASYDLPSPLPRNPVNIQLNKLRGRGKVELVERPSAANNYTAVVLIQDAPSGDDFYEFELSWSTSTNSN
jgi:outer membrane lipoprotein SlyB